MDKELIDSAAGRTLCDLTITGCRLVDVLSGRIMENASVSIKNGIVVGLNDNQEARECIDLGGAYLAPGLIDAHVHIESSLLTPAEYAKVVLPRGTTTVVADPHEIVNVLGYDGMRFMLSASEGLPLDIFYMVPSCVPATEFDTSGAALYASDMYPFLHDERVLGLGEVMNYPGVLAKESSLMDKIAFFSSARRPIDGHAPGLSGASLSAYILAGIGSDHECTNPDEAREKLSKGMYIMLREGSTAKDLKNLLPAVTAQAVSRFMICSDDRHSNDLRDEGHMDHALRLLLAGGIAPIDAFRIAALNASQWFDMRSVGAVAPGRKADFVVFTSFDDFKAEKVFKAGRLIAENGRLLIDFAGKPMPIRDSVNLKLLSAEDFSIPDKACPIRVIEAKAGSIITGSCQEFPTVENGLCVADIERDLIKIFVIERHSGSGRIGKGFIRGLGLRRGAIGGTISHDSHNMIVAGVDDRSIFKAAKHLNKLKGGLVYAVGDEILLDLPLPVAGLMSDRDADFVIQRLRSFEELFAEEGVANPSPLMTLSFMALPVIPSLKITDAGLIDVDRFAPVSLYIEKKDKNEH
ncbi:MAG: adenine deaminase [Spirochaetia bacterium]|jgi:adenine deaminase|nr:adenine deaminase [Spirochaetia bacterium]